MSGKNFGPNVSGYLDPTGRNYETTVFQAGKAVLDKELNLVQDDGSSQILVPSGWQADDYLRTSSSTTFFTPSSTSNQLALGSMLLAIVKGKPIFVTNTNVNGGNQLDLGAGPSGAGSKRTDLVILEVWRMLLSASPSTVGKSPSGRIWLNGNVKIPSASDLTLNPPDDILDTNVGTETTKRVQIQYRLRVIQGVDIFANPYGMNDSAVFANTVPPNAATPDGSATSFHYVSQSFNGDLDPGLCVAGDGNPSNALGTVDGYMYAIPLVAVFRRNTTGFDRNTNHNGGVASPGPSDRPDGYFQDIVVARDIADLRFGVRVDGWDYAELLQKNFNFLLDNLIQTEWATTPNGGGYNGHTVIWGDEIGISTAHGGDGVTTGDTPGATFIGEFDSARRSISDRAIYEVITVAVTAPGGGWVNGSVVTIDPTTLAIYPYAAFNWASFAPGSVRFLDVLALNFISNVHSTPSLHQGRQYVTRIAGVNASPVGPLHITLGAIPGTISGQTLYVDILVAYPPGLGLTMTPTGTYGAGTFGINNPSTLLASAPISYSGLAGSNAIDPPHREALLQYTTSTLSLTIAADVSGNPVIWLPERAASVTNVTKNSVGISGSVTLDATGRFFTFNNSGDYPVSGDAIGFNYVAIRPIPQCGVQMTLYYDARAPQTARSSLLGTSLTLIPLLMGNSVYTLTTGSGSQDEGYPFPSAYAQMGGVYPTSASSFSGEQELAASGEIDLPGFSVESGFMMLPSIIPYVSAPEAMTFNRGSGDTDIEGRTYFKSVPSGYIPNAFGVSMLNAKRHRNIVPVLAEISTDGPLGPAGQLVLVLLLRDAVFDDTNGVFFEADLTQSRTTAAIFRIKGHPLARRF